MIKLKWQSHQDHPDFYVSMPISEDDRFKMIVLDKFKEKAEVASKMELFHTLLKEEMKMVQQRKQILTDLKLEFVNDFAPTIIDEFPERFL